MRRGLTICEVVWEAGESPVCEADEGVVPDIVTQRPRDALDDLQPIHPSSSLPSHRSTHVASQNCDTVLE